MTTIKITGGRQLAGSVKIHGAKNSVLPILAATLLHEGKSVIHDCPWLKDVQTTFRILRKLGCEVRYEDGTAYINAEGICGHQIPDDLMREMRSSVVFLGAIIGRCGSARVSYPGGCELGARPIDLHLKAFREMGVRIEENHGYLECETEHILPCQVNLSFPSVGATENVMLLAVLAKGETVLTGAAREPEIVDLQNFLNEMGARVSGAGTDVIRVCGVKKLHDAEHRIIPDRIVAATYASAAAVCGGDIRLENVIPEHIQSVIHVLQEAGCEITVENGGIRVQRRGELLAVRNIRTMPYPGFPTDAQAPLMAAMCTAKGSSVFSETMFESRYKHVGELVRMGADIAVKETTAIVRGVKRLHGAPVLATDLRGGAALAVAGLAADGITEIGAIGHIDRGYVSIESDLTALGADICRVTE